MAFFKPIPTSGGGAGSSIPAYNYVTKTTAYNAVIGDWVNCTSGTFTVTLPTAASVAGQLITVRNVGTGIITIATTSSQTIDGLTTRKLAASMNDTLTVASDGANWMIQAHTYDSVWTAYTMVFTSSGASPTKATTPDVNAARWRRSGSDIEIEFQYSHTNNTGAATGTGNYYYSIPTAYTMDTSKMNANGGITVSGGAASYSTTAGVNQAGFVRFVDSTHFILHTGNATIATNPVGASNCPMGDASVYYSFQAKAPITDWF